MVQFSQDPRVQNGINETLEHISEAMGMSDTGFLSETVRLHMEGLVDIVSEQLAALEEVKLLTGNKFSKINIDDVKHIDPSAYDESLAIASAIDNVARIEAVKLLYTSDFITEVKKFISELDASAVDEAGSELRAARKVVGKAIKSSIKLFDQFKGILFSISHMPDAYIKADVEPLREKMSTLLEPQEV